MTKKTKGRDRVTTKTSGACLTESIVSDLCRACVIAQIVEEIEFQQLDLGSAAKSELLNILTELLEAVQSAALGLCVLEQRGKTK